MLKSTWINHKYSIFVIIFFLMVGPQVKGQQKYFIAFSNKNGTPYSLSNPSEFLSQKSIERRQKQNISLSESDLPVSPVYIQQIKNTGAKVLYTLKWFNGAVAEVYSNEMLESIKNLSFVATTILIFQPGIKASILGDEEIFSVYSRSKETNDYYKYGGSANQTKMLNGHFLHNKGFRGKGITIGVLDAGFYKVNTLPAFDSLRLDNRIIRTKDFVNSSSNIYNEHTHGMLVLSAMAGNIPESLIGTAPEANYVLIRTEDATSEQIIEEYNWAAGAEFADSIGVDVINSSLGYYSYDVFSQSHSYLNMDGKTTPSAKAANFAAATGMIIIASAGNEGTNDWKHIITPSDAAGCLAIGAVNEIGVLASFSSIGPSADGRIKPDIVAQGYRTVVQGINGDIGSANGTSLSAPIITGLTACLWQALPNLTAIEISQRMIKSASKFSNPDNLKGYGLPNYLAAMDIEIPQQNGERLLLFPNPAGNEINLLLPSPLPSSYKIILANSTGRILQTVESNTNASVHIINLPSNYPSGIYIVQLITESGKNYGKVIKI